MLSLNSNEASRLRYQVKKAGNKSLGVISDINHTNIFPSQSPKAIEIKAKISKWT